MRSFGSGSSGGALAGTGKGPVLPGFLGESADMSLVGGGHREPQRGVRMFCFQSGAEFGFEILFEDFHFGVELETVFDDALVTRKVNDTDTAEAFHFGVARELDFV